MRISIARHNVSLVEAVDAVVSGEYSGQNNGRFSDAIVQAIIEGERDVYAAFAKLSDASSRIFTTWWPDSIRVKIGAILECTSID
jgi:hypothetical protein